MTDSQTSTTHTVNQADKSTALVTRLLSSNGRTARARFWRIQAIGLVSLLIAGIQPVMLIVGMLAFLPISLFASIQRLHDVNKSAWWLVPYIGLPTASGLVELIAPASGMKVVLAVVSILLQTWGIVELGFRPGSVGTNRFGEDPLGAFRRENRSSQFLFAAYSVAALLTGALLAATTFSRPFSIKSFSQAPVLIEGDYALFSNLERGYTSRDIRQGDLVAFKVPHDKSVIFISRVIGLPGDKVRLEHGTVIVNGARAERERVSDYVGENPCASSLAQAPDRLARYIERLPNGSSYETLECSDRAGFPNDTGDYTVPPGHIFVIGHNRQNSIDSRYSHLGFIPIDNVVGRGQLILFSMREGAVRWERLFTRLR